MLNQLKNKAFSLLPFNEQRWRAKHRNAFKSMQIIPVMFPLLLEQKAIDLLTYIKRFSSSRSLKDKKIRSKRKRNTTIFSLFSVVMLSSHVSYLWEWFHLKIHREISSRMDLNQSMSSLSTKIRIVLPIDGFVPGREISSSGDNVGLGRSGFDVLRGTRRWKYNDVGRRLADFDEIAAKSEGKISINRSRDGERERETWFCRWMQCTFIMNIGEK